MNANYNRSRTAVVVALSGLCACGAAAVAQAEAPFWSVGLGATSTRVHVEVGGVDEAGWVHGPSEAGYLIGGEVRFTKHLGLDLAYLHADGLRWTGKFSQTNPTSPCDWFASIWYGYCVRWPTPYEGQMRLDASALQASAVGIATVGSVWEFYGKGGVASYRLSGHEEVVDISSGVSSGERFTREVNKSGSGILVGFGADAKLTPSWRLRLEYQTFLIDDDVLSGDNQTATLDTWSLMLYHRFSSRPGERD